MEVKIQIPDNCELIKDGNTYIVKEKKGKPKSWEEFCENYPRTKDEYFIEDNSDISQIYNVTSPRNAIEDKNICTSREEAEAFLALMQLRQLRKAWVGDWKEDNRGYHGIVNSRNNGLIINSFADYKLPLTFPTPKMAGDFLKCFRDLCETAKVLL